MRVLGALFLLLGLMLGVVPRPAEASPCPFHSHTQHAATGQDSDQGAEKVAPSAAATELTASIVPALTEVPSPKPLSGHTVPEGQACCHAAATAVPALMPPLGPHARTGRRLALPAFLLRRPLLGADIYRPPATT
jgi:hypothetical protein